MDLKITFTFISLTFALSAQGQTAVDRLFNTPTVKDPIYNYIPTDTVSDFKTDVLSALSISPNTDGTHKTLQEILAQPQQQTPQPDTESEIVYIDNDYTDDPLEILDLVRADQIAPAWFFRPVVYNGYKLLDPVTLNTPVALSTLPVPTDAFNWLEDYNFHSALFAQSWQNFFIKHPGLVRYNEFLLPEPPKKFIATIDPETAKINITEAPPTLDKAKHQNDIEFERRHWLKTFNGSLQFSQAFVSPNWYQGGNNNINMIMNAFYNVKLNPAFHPRWLFETTVQYKLGFNNAPNDTLRSYSISEDLFQANLLAGFKASKRWYYSSNISFKTQFLNNYKTNTRDLKAAFLSPGELNVGLGMTYNYTTPKKNFTCDLSISPLSWNLKTCINNKMDETTLGLEKGQTSRHEIGSSGECKLFWQLTYNISYRTRLFAFTDYDYFQSDWEHTLSFNINRFLSTQIYAHLRYDTHTNYDPDSSWHKLQMKEILSFGFNYRFSSI